MSDVYIFDHVRTPRGRGRAESSLHPVTPIQLAAAWPIITPVLEKQPDVAEVKRRLLHVQALEAARCLEEGSASWTSVPNWRAVMARVSSRRLG